MDSDRLWDWDEENGYNKIIQVVLPAKDREGATTESSTSSKARILGV